MASPSAILASYRRAVATSSSSKLLQSATRAPAGRTLTSTRWFGASTQCYKEDLSTDSTVKTDRYPDADHTTTKASKGDRLDVQSSNAQDAMNSTNKSGGHATEGKDSAGGVAKAKKENPEAPDPAIGMQDERGGRGA